MLGGGWEICRSKQWDAPQGQAKLGHSTSSLSLAASLSLDGSFRRETREQRGCGELLLSPPSQARSQVKEGPHAVTFLGIKGEFTLLGCQSYTF